MKSIFFFAFFLLFSVSYARRFDVAVTPDDHRPTTESSSHDADPNIRLPVETRPAPDLTQSQQPDLVTVDFDLTQSMNRGHVHIGFPFIRHFLRLCRHNPNNPDRVIGLGPRIEGDPVDDMTSLLKKYAEVIGHRHESRGFPEAERLAQFEQSFIPRHRIRHDHDIVRAGVAVTRVRVGNEKRENEEEHHDHHQRHHHEHEEDEMKREKEENDHDHDHEHGHDHHDHDHEKHEKKGNEMVNKIRKFLLNF